MKKYFYFDLETTGYDSKENGITEIGALYVEDDKVIDELNLFVNPKTYNKDVVISQDSLDFRNITEADLRKYDSSKTSFKKLIKWLDSKVDKYNRDDKLTIVGYNSNFFDYPFLREWFNDNEHKYFWSYFEYEKIDVFKLVKEKNIKAKNNLTDNKLVTISEHYEIKLNAHIALDDVYATYKIHQKLI